MSFNVVPIKHAAPEPGSALDYALRYAALGWHVFPVWPGEDGHCTCRTFCKSPAKHPISHLVPRGQDDATIDPATIRRWWGQYPNASIGVFLFPSGLLAIDIDPRNGGYFTIEVIEIQHGELVSDVMATTQGGGQHRIFSLRSDVAVTLPGKLGDGVDVKRNGYIVLPPSKGILGEYTWEPSSDPLEGCIPSPLPDWLRDLSAPLAPSLTPDEAAGCRYCTPEQVEELRDALTCIPADERDTWINIGMALATIGASGWELWNTWSQTSAKYDRQDQTRVWRSFKRNNGRNIESVFFEAQRQGWVNPLGGCYGETALPVAPDPVANFLEPLADKPATRPVLAAPIVSIANPDPAPVAEAYQFPVALLQVPGLVGAVAEYITQSALFPQPVLALAASLSFCGAIMGRKVRTDTDLRTNIYTIAVADSGSGKEHARKAIKKLAQAADAEIHIGGEKLASDQGLFALLDQHPSPVVLMDEFGRSLRVMTNDRAPPHLVQLLTTIMELTGCADSYIMEKRRAEHGSKVQPRRVIQPNLCLYATTVPGRLYQGLTPDEVTDGFLPRWLVFESDCPDPEFQEQRITTISRALAEHINGWVQRPAVEVGPGGNLDFQVPIIEMTPAATALLSARREQWNQNKRHARGKGLDALWARAAEHALRMALIRGAGDQGLIDEASLMWASDLTDHLLARMSTQALANLATNDHESTVHKVQAFLRKERVVTLSAFTIRFQWLKKQERDNLLSMLLDAGQIAIQKTGNAGRPKTEIFWVDSQ